MTKGSRTSKEEKAVDWKSQTSLNHWLKEGLGDAWSLMQDKQTAILYCQALFFSTTPASPLHFQTKNFLSPVFFCGEGLGDWVLLLFGLQTPADRFHPGERCGPWAATMPDRLGAFST